MCDECNVLRGEIEELINKLLGETALRGIFEGKSVVLEKQVISQQTTINTLMDMIRKEK